METRRWLAPLGIAALLLTVAPARADEGEAPSAGIGYELSGLGSVDESKPVALQDPSASPANPLWLRVQVLWADIEKDKGVYDWSDADKVVDRFRAASYAVILDLWGGNPLYMEDILSPPKAIDAEALDAWLKFVRAASTHFKDRVRYYQIGRSPNAAAMWGGQDAAKSYAFLLKKAASVVRGEAKGSLVVSGGLSGPDAAWLKKLYAEGAAPYLDVVSFRPDPKRDLGPQCDTLVAAILEGDASAKLWVEGIQAAGTGEQAGADLVRSYLIAIEHGATLVTFALPWTPAGVATGADALVRLHSAVGRAARVPCGDRLQVADASGQAPGALRSTCFYDAASGTASAGVWIEGAKAPQTLSVGIQGRRPGPPILYDPVSGGRSQPAFAPAEGGEKGAADLAGAPLFLVYKEGVTAGSGAEGKESLEVSAVRGITAEEILAKHRQFQVPHDARLDHWRSAAMIKFHYGLAGYSRTIDVGMAGEYFFDRKGAEWEIRDYYLNGNRSKWKEFPELPFVQPEKVMMVPLEITFDASYAYEYAGEATLDGHECYILAFQPVDPSRPLSKGRVWIEKSTGARVRVSAVQTHLEPPFLSNEETTTFAPVKGQDGLDYWLLSRLDGQQIFSASGRSLIFVREITFQAPLINDDGFEAARKAAYDSAHQILRDTDKGYRYLEKTPEGGRKLKDTPDSNQLFGVAGILYDPGLSSPVPLVGVNYFDFNFLKSDLQTNIFFAGPFLAMNVTDPNIGGWGFDLGTDLALSALKRTDREFEGGEEVKARSVATRTQSISINFGRQIADFIKLQASYELTYQAYDTDDDTSSQFTVPADTLIHSASLFGAFNRAGWEARANVGYSVRKTFDYWGRPCQKFNPFPPARCGPNAGENIDFDPKAGGYYKYQAGGSKEFYLKEFQKVRVSADGFGGSDLDRFSRYAFDRLGQARLPGFGGSGIRFDTGAIVRGAYLFNIAELFRLEASLDWARVKSMAPGEGWGSHTGLGISGNVLGPWKTVWQLEGGFALASDIEPVQGNFDVLLVVLKLF